MVHTKINSKDCFFQK